MAGDESRIVKGYNPTMGMGQPDPLRLDANHRLLVTGSGGTTNIEVDGVDVDVDNPLPVTGITYDRPFAIAVTPTITAGAYAAADAVGGLLTFANAARVAGTGGRIVKVVIIDDAKQLAPFDIIFFDQTFTATADNAPFDPSDADMQNCIGHITVAATDYSSFVDNSEAVKCSGLTMPFYYDLATGGTSLFAQLVVRSAPTYAATDDITVKIVVERY